MPAQSTVFVWLTKHSEFRELYTLAREHQGESFGDRIGEIAGSVLDADGPDPQRARVAIDALKWVSERQAPRKYGAVNRHELSGVDGGPIETETNVTMNELARRMAFALSQGKPKKGKS